MAKIHIGRWIAITCIAVVLICGSLLSGRPFGICFDQLSRAAMMLGRGGLEPTDLTLIKRALWR
jgi:hypothetical protein